MVATGGLLVLAPHHHHQQQGRNGGGEDGGRAHGTIVVVVEKGNGGGAPVPAPARKPRNREITSRYKSPTTSSSPSPSKRAQSTERRRPSPPRTPEPKLHPSSGSSGSTHVPKCLVRGRSELLWPSTHSMSVSMLREPFSPPSSNNALPKSHIDGIGKRNSLGSDHALKPSANVAERHAVQQRKGTPERKGTTPLHRQSIDQAENARPLENGLAKPDHHHWPGSCNGKALGGSSVSRSVDLTIDRERPLSRPAHLLVQGKPALNTSRLPRPVASSRALSQSINEGPALGYTTRRTQVESRGRSRESPTHVRKALIRDIVQSIGSPQVRVTPALEAHGVRQSNQEAELTSSDAIASADNASDTNSASSGGTGIALATGRSTPVSETGARVVRGTTVPARFWQDAANRSRRLSDFNRVRSSMPESDLETATGGKLGNQQKVSSSSEIQAGSNAIHNCVSSSPWSMSPSRSVPTLSPPQQHLSPVKLGQISSSARTMPSPTRSRGIPLPLPGTSLQTSRSNNAAAMLSFGMDARKGKKGLTQIEESQLHRILHNRLLQWRFVNARTEAAMKTQRLTAENLLYNILARISELRGSVTMKRIQLQQARQAHKLHSILSAQVWKLKDWSCLQKEHSNALFGAIESLEAAILRVPITGGVRADIQAVKEAIGAAVDVMIAVESSVTNLLPKAEKTNGLVCELALVAAQERALLQECGDVLGIASAFEVEEQSLRMHLIQLQQEKADVLGHLMDITAASDSVLLSSP